MTAGAYFRRIVLAGMLAFMMLAGQGALGDKPPAEAQTMPASPRELVGFDLSQWRVRFIEDAIHEYTTGETATFTTLFPRIWPVITSDADYLSSKGVRSVRVWATLPQFFDDNGQARWDAIANLQRTLSYMESRNLKVHLVVNSIYNCGDPDGWFDYRALSDARQQNVQMARLATVLGAIYRNRAVRSIDLLNEGSALLEQGYVDTVINRRSRCMTATPAQLRTYVLRASTLVRQINQSWGVTLSYAGLHDSRYAYYEEYIGRFLTFYDIHMYISGERVNDPAAYYANWPAKLNKPFIHGEIGIDTTVRYADGVGVPCDSAPAAPFDMNYPRKANNECEQLQMTNTQRWYEEARRRGASGLYFFNWHTTNRFVMRTYTRQSSGIYNVAGYQPSPAGSYLFGLTK